MNALKTVEEAFKREIPHFRIGDTVKVKLKVKEGEKERIQAYQGVVIARKGGGIRETFMVRKISNGIGVERIIHLHSHLFAGIEVVKQGVVRRPNL